MQDQQQQHTTEEDAIETVYLYVYDEDPEQARFFARFAWPRFPLPHLSWSGKRAADLAVQWAAFLVLSACSLLMGAPFFTIQTISVPMRLLPLQQFRASAAIVPTGVQTIPAVQAHGVLTIYNGSVVVESLPAGFLVTTRQGVEVAIDAAVTIPAENTSVTPPSQGVATVAAHAVEGGTVGNIALGAVNTVVGSALYLKNLSAFSGGQDTQTTHVVIARDRAHARAEARQQVQQQQAHRHASGLLPRPCQEHEQQTDTQVTVRLACQYGTYAAPKGVTVLRAEVQGNRVVLQVKTVVLP